MRPLARALLVALCVALFACGEDPRPPAEDRVGAPAPRVCDTEAPCLRACEGGDDSACNDLLAMYLTGRTALRSRPRAAALTQRLCESGRRSFCPSFAMALSEGSGVAQDRARARELFEGTCQYDPVACGEFGSLYASGTGVTQDLELGRRLLDLSCQHGDAAGCRDLARITGAPPPR